MTESRETVRQRDARRVSPQVTSLMTLAIEVENACQGLEDHTVSQLADIALQIRRLQEDAKRVLEAAARDARLHRAACSMIKKPGQLYHLYQRSDSDEYLSFLSPRDWNGTPPHVHLGSYRLEYNMTWTSEECIERKDLLLAPIRAYVANTESFRLRENTLGTLLPSESPKLLNMLQLDNHKFSDEARGEQL